MNRRFLGPHAVMRSIPQNRRAVPLMHILHDNVYLMKWPGGGRASEDIISVCPLLVFWKMLSDLHVSQIKTYFIYLLFIQARAS